MVVGLVALLVAGGLFGYSATLTTSHNITMGEVGMLTARLENQASRKLGRGDVVQVPEHPSVIAKRWKLASYIAGGAGLLFLVTGWAVRGAAVASGGKAQ